MKQVLSGHSIIFNGVGIPFKSTIQKVRELKDGEILVKIRYTTICGSDLHTYSGLRKEVCPTILGHEMVAEIVEIQKTHNGFDYHGNPLSKGDLVTWAVFCSAPHSLNSLKGIPQKGDELFKYGHALVTGEETFHGGLGEYCILRKNTCILKLAFDVPLKVASTINCAISTVAGSIRLAGDVKGKRVVIFGMGALGITCAAMCRDIGASWVCAADIDKNRLQKATIFGAHETVYLKADHSSDTASDKENPAIKNVDIVFDMSGSPDAMELGLSMLGIGGTAVWVGAVFNSRKINVDAEVVVRNMITIKGLHNYNYDDFCNAVDFINSSWKSYPFESMVEKEFSLFEVQEAFDFAAAEKPLRVGIKMESNINNHGL